MVSADVSDWQDGAITNPDAYVWSSDKDGQLGTGSWIVLSNLTPGEHTLTVTVTDSGGAKATASLHVTINALGTSLNSGTPFHLPVWVWVIAGLVVILLIGGLGFIVVRARK